MRRYVAFRVSVSAALAAVLVALPLAALAPRERVYVPAFEVVDTRPGTADLQRLGIR